MNGQISIYWLCMIAGILACLVLIITIAAKWHAG
jgi:hypothetical protein